MLTIGFARRVPTYKRLTLMLRDPDRLEKLLLDDERPVQLIVAGKSHPADDGGKALIQQIVRFADRPEVRHRIAFLPDYDMSMARFLYWGCDVWLNNPLRPLEACGTSGMKSALNGGLNLSIRDGWWDEWYDGENGWEIPTADGLADEAPPRRPGGVGALRPAGEVGHDEVLRTRRARRAAAVDGDGAAHAAGARPEGAGVADGARLHREVLRAGGGSRCTARSRRSTACRSARPVTSRRSASGRADCWPNVRITDVDSYGLPDTPLLGSELTLTATVHLAELRPDEVVVQAVVGRVDAADALVDPVAVPMAHTGSADGNDVFSSTTPLPVAGRVGYTVRVLPHHRLLAADDELGLVTPRVSRIFEVAVDGGPYALAAGSDGAMWVTLVHRGAIARVGRGRCARGLSGGRGQQAVDHHRRARRRAVVHPRRRRPDRPDLHRRVSSTSFELRSGSAPFGITVGPDGALWFTAMGTGVVGRIDVDGEISEEAVPGGMPSMITTGPDNALWFTLNRANADRPPRPRRGHGAQAADAQRGSGRHRADPRRRGVVHRDPRRQGRAHPDERGDAGTRPARQAARRGRRSVRRGVGQPVGRRSDRAACSADGEVDTIDLPAGSEPHGLAIGPDGALWVALEAGFVMRLPTA